MVFNINLIEIQKIIIFIFILQTFIFVVRANFASGPTYWQELEKKKIKKEVESLLAQGKIRDARKLARKYGVCK